MYTLYSIENEKKDECAIVFRFDGQKMSVDNGLRTTEISREELESLVEWLKVNLEKLNRDHWDAVHAKTCNCVNVANE